MGWTIAWIVVGAIAFTALLYWGLSKLGVSGSMAPSLHQQATWKADTYVTAVFHGTGATMETVLAERDRYTEELLRRWAAPITEAD